MSDDIFYLKQQLEKSINQYANEYLRLKKLDDNVQREIKEVKETLANQDGLSNLGRDWFNELLRILECLRE